MNCSQCFNLTASGITGTYSLKSRVGATENAWFYPNGQRVTSAAAIAILFSLINTEQKRKNTEVLCTSTNTIILLTPFGAAYKDHSSTVSFAGKEVRSITVMVKPDTNNPIELSFDGGTTYPLKMVMCETKGWGDNDLLNIDLLRIRPVTGNASFDIHGEE